MTSKSEVRNAEYSTFPLSEGTFTAGQDDNTTIAAGDVGEVAVAEVGEDGALSDYIGLIVGQEPDTQARSGQGKILFNPKDDSTTPARLDENTEMKLVVRKKGERGGKDLTGWIPIRDNGPNDATSDRKVLRPRMPVAKDGRVVALHVRNQNVSVTYNHSGSEWVYPCQGGQ